LDAPCPCCYMKIVFPGKQVSIGPYINRHSRSCEVFTCVVCILHLTVMLLLLLSLWLKVLVILLEIGIYRLCHVCLLLLNFNWSRSKV
jgi:hypothetical protein